ncbi:MAG: hypothetical protein GPJ54_17550 [Candidatus Heimdallarchaeota archaeon]|nr:hypothetical protein [Candidatus Heimdallarchaeota archaeon]
MKEINITNSKIQEILNSLGNLQLDVEGKKPLKPELALYFLLQIAEINDNLSVSSEIIDKYNTEFSQQLGGLIQKYEEKTQELEITAQKLSDNYDLISNKLEKNDTIEKQVITINETLRQSNEILARNEEWQSLIAKNEKNVELNQDFITKLQHLTETISNKDEGLGSLIQSYDTKIQELISLQKGINEEKEKTLSVRALLEEREKALTLKEKHLDEETQKLSLAETALVKRDKELAETQSSFLKLSNDLTLQFEEVKLAQTQIMETMTETTELLSEKTYLYKLEDELMAKEKELTNNIAKYDRDKETLSKQISKFSILLDKTSNNLTLNEMTTEMLGNSVSHFNSQVKTISSISETMEGQVRNIHQEREEYQRIGNLITDQLDEINKQSDGMMKLNVLSTYIHQTILELRDAESSLKMIIDSSSKNTQENKKATDRINKFLDSAGKLFDTTQQQIESFTLNSESLRNTRNELIEVQFALKQNKIQLEKVETTLTTKEKRLMRVEKTILDKSMEDKLASKTNKD